MSAIPAPHSSETESNRFAWLDSIPRLRPSPREMKELRLLAPALLIALAVPAFAWAAFLAGWLDFHRPWDPRTRSGRDADFLDFVPGIFALRFLLLNLAAAALFGAEFENRTFERLLSEPVSRLRIWGLKIGILGGTFGAILLFDAAWIYAADAAAYIEPVFVAPMPGWLVQVQDANHELRKPLLVGSMRFALSGHARDMVRADASILLWSLFATTTATLMTRHTYTGFLGGILAPVLYFIAMAWWWPEATTHVFGQEHASFAASFHLLQLVPVAVLAWLGTWRIRRMEVT